MRRKVVITGAGGYVGRHVVEAVADLGYHPIAVVRRHRAGDLDPRADLIEADVLAEDFRIEDVVPVDELAAVIHLAWQDGFVHNAPSHMAHLSSHYGFLARLTEAGVPRVAALGTMHEVGYWEGAITADSPTNPVTLYGIAKDALRRSMIRTVATGLCEFVWLRAYYIVGDDRRSSSIFAKLLEASDRGQKVFPFTTGKTLYDFIDVDVLGRQIAVAATSPGVVGVVNTCSGVPESLASRVERFIASHGLDVGLQFGAFPDRVYDSPGVWGDATVIRELMSTSRFAEDVR